MAHIKYPDLLDMDRTIAYYTQEYKDLDTPLAPGRPRHYWDTVKEDPDDDGDVITYLRYLGTNGKSPRYYVGKNVLDLTIDDPMHIDTKMTFFIAVNAKRVKRELTNLTSYFEDEGIEILALDRPWKPYRAGAAAAVPAVTGASASSASGAAPGGAPPSVAIVAAGATAAAAAAATVAAPVQAPRKGRRSSGGSPPAANDGRGQMRARLLKQKMDAAKKS